jgi:type-F conjugative transfer system mating-pair stabilization protein TraN
MRYLLLLIILLKTQVLYSNSWKNLESGDQAAKSLLNQFETDKAKAGANPFFHVIPNEANLSDSDLTQHSQKLSPQSTVGQFVKSSSDTRPKFNIDTKTDPLLWGSEKILSNPLEAIGDKDTRLETVYQSGKDETVLCEERGDETAETCVTKLNVRVVKRLVKKELKGSFQYSKCCHSEKHGHYLPCQSLIQAVGNASLTMSGNRRNFRKMFPQKEASPQDIDKALNITAHYKACITELAANPRGCYECNTHLNHGGLYPEQIKEVHLERHPAFPKSLYFKDNYFHMYKSGRTEYRYAPAIKIIYEEEKKEVLPDEWVSDCARLEERADLGVCRYGSRSCTQGCETRVIEDMPITRDCWQYTYTYYCSYPSKETCGPLRARGCTQIESNCKQKVGNVCVVYEQTYLCKGNAQTQYSIKGGKTPFCLDGNCRDQSWELNDEMLSSMAQLSLLKEMQGQFANGLVFKGEDKSCSKYILDFKDCCGTDKGWGKDLGLASCSAGEKDLSKKRKKGLCHFVGTYCAKKVLGQCVKKKSSYCCFTNKLLKAFHVQGRPQIGLGWGDPKEPLCRGFTVEEIQRIDFSKIDLTEAFDEIMQNFKGSKVNTKDMGQKINDRMKTIQKGIGPNSKVPPKQRNDA